MNERFLTTDDDVSAPRSPYVPGKGFGEDFLPKFNTTEIKKERHVRNMSYDITYQIRNMEKKIETERIELESKSLKIKVESEDGKS